MNEVLAGNNILLFFVQGAHFFLMALLAMLLLRQYRLRVKLLLGIIMAFWTVLHIKDMIIYYGQEFITENQINQIIMFDQLAVPLSIVFQLVVINDKNMNLKRIGILIMPFVLLFISYVLYPANIIIVLSLIFSCLYLLLMIVATFYSCYNKPFNLPECKLAYITLSALSLIGVSWFISCIRPTVYSDIIYYILSGFSWIVICYAIDNIYPKCHIRENVIKGHNYPFANKLHNLIKEEQIFLNANLSISGVARQIGTNRSYLSEYFNNTCNTSFVDYINNLRLEHSEKLMIEFPKMSLEEIAISSGFNSLSTFRRAFTKKHGVTPSNYKQGLNQTN